ncbi:GH21357 [Drosophila grimshawi]|uniref:GH21357 n=2 Tax=Drosophila grimshawi TaxID=7222 RepID=B4J8M1_DROGR|nr:GH21357 [Drosophila grimshawi]
MSCFVVEKVDYKDRCLLVKSAEQCSRVMGVFKYYHLMYCTVEISNKPLESAVMCLLMLIAIYLLIFVAHIIEIYFTPALKIVSVKLNMNEYLAGITVLTFCNTLPDLITNIMHIRQHAPLFTICISNSLVIILLSGGTVSYMRSFKVNGACGLRDLLCLIFSAEVLYYIILTGESLDLNECIGLMMFYVLYLLINVVDLMLLRAYIKKLKLQISKLKRTPHSPYRDNLIAEIKAKNRELSQDNHLIIHTKQSSFIRSSSKHGISTLTPDSHTNEINIKETRDILHNSNNPKNLFLCSEFLEALIPINIGEFRRKGWCGRLFCILISPIVLLCTIFVPLVDYTHDKHGWCKLLNCLQIVIIPYMVTTVTKGLIDGKYQDWYMTFDYSIAKWTFIVTVPLAIFVLIHSRTDKPPSYHVLFIVLTATTSIMFITIAANELEVLCVISGFYFNVSESFVAAVVRSFAGGLADLIMNLELALQGYERMAFAAVLAGPIFSITFGMGISCIINQHCSAKGSLYWLTEDQGQNAFIFFMLVVSTTLAWNLMYNFCARRSSGAYAFIMYFLFILYAVLVEWNLVHEFSADIAVEPK